MSKQKDKLKNLLKKRSSRKAVKPAKLYGGKSVKKRDGEVPKKFASYLYPQSIKQLKKIAIDTDRKDYQVLQDAVDRYIKAYHQGKIES